LWKRIWKNRDGGKVKLYLGNFSEKIKLNDSNKNLDKIKKVFPYAF
jgi:hypothetical protein